MAKRLTELVFILDRSGSMSGLEADTIGGFNSMINKQKKEEGEAIIVRRRITIGCNSKLKSRLTPIRPRGLACNCTFLSA